MVARWREPGASARTEEADLRRGAKFPPLSLAAPAGMAQDEGTGSQANGGRDRLQRTGDAA